MSSVRPRILIVDDTPSNIAVVDLLMSRLDGGEACGRLKAAPGALRLAERFQTALADRNLHHPNSSVLPYVTLTIGAATLVPTLEAQAQSLTETADLALNRAKGAGRNRICSD